MEAILRAYADALRRTGNVLVTDPELWQGCERQARGIVRDCLRALDGEPRQLTEDVEFDSMALGARRALQHVPAEESVAASHVLFDTVFQALTDPARGLLRGDGDRDGGGDGNRDGGDGTARLASAVASLHHSIKIRVQAAFIGYEAFVAHSVGEADSTRRAQLAGDLHDRVGGGLSLALRCLELYEAERGTEAKTGDGAPKKNRDRLEEAKRALLDAIWFTRELVTGLQSAPPEAGLRVRLEEYAATAAAGSVDVGVRVNGDEDWVPGAVREEVFLVAREGLRNALRHAGASVVGVEVDVTPQSVAGVVADDGRGFVVDGARGGGGLASMRDRVRALGGELTVHSRVGRGTCVVFRVPLHRGGRRGDDR
ncbi:sensor histidine kinase [Streptomyces mashuensis]|uniref:sensor histidine kinase n=1 Tax=Streptomyces mashuensis TaxID=33904 RepID=UPI00167E4B35|nr:ATP-binding protein [Streptomyces mashuensis]